MAPRSPPGVGGGGGQQPQLVAGLCLSEGASGSPQGPKQGSTSPVQCSKMVGTNMVGNYSTPKREQSMERRARKKRYARTDNFGGSLLVRPGLLPSAASSQNGSGRGTCLYGASRARCLRWVIPRKKSAPVRDLRGQTCPRPPSGESDWRKRLALPLNA
jgi:hypothetical protein